MRNGGQRRARLWTSSRSTACYRRDGLSDLPHATLAFTLDLAVYVIASIACGVAMARAVEGPSLMLRDRLFPSRAGSLVAGAPPGEADSQTVARV